MPVNEMENLIKALSEVEIFNLGWNLRCSMEGHVFDKRDLCRSMLGYPTLEKLTPILEPDYLGPRNEGVVDVKMFIINNLSD